MDYIGTAQGSWTLSVGVTSPLTLAITMILPCTIPVIDTHEPLGGEAYHAGPK